MVLFAVIDIFGTIPMIIALKEKTGGIYPLRASLVALMILVGFLFLGESILGVIGVGINEFAVAGSFVLFFRLFVKMYELSTHNKKLSSATKSPMNEFF